MWTPTGATPVTADSQQDEEALLEAANVVVQLTENFRHVTFSYGKEKSIHVWFVRLNPDLGEFVSTIYSRQFKPQKVQARRLALVLQEIPQMDATQTGVDRSILIKVRDFLLGLSKVMLRVPQNILRTPRRRLEDTFKATTTASGTDKKLGLDLGHYPVSLSLVRLKTLSSRSDQFGYETHVHGEAAVAAALIACIRYCCPEDDIFVATPHRIQREAVKAALVRMKSANAQRKRDSLDYAFARMSIGQEPMYNITVDTIERLQGSEASFVICLFSLPDSHTNDLGFLLERRRLNVAISRAKTLCVLVASPQVLSPPVTVFANEQTAKGFAFLKAYEERAWSYDISVNVDTINVP
ncbi:hypothetical protein CC1G_14236 [Coprinopsis cinerea okayama7|uniref:DNA2/NAM7 helicase-like C-terminal domain-containing protein n=1 Tax=Coprinopsis cinerea (strain Okayama-7 / 130 / ATCC MYA-4618 / FGSC 9003) TaxID=240176 RepID=D6RLP3_COPC7|nr:hypothetical protein CC1G_14236 [Coprinopsis cinerea okayama7\|eukprot:XP_002911705.1 hypothetical protein CC1G_14236 [Coprinopsis cinerea okayama7\